MKKGLFLLSVLGLAAMWVGCKKTEPTAPSPAKESAQVSTPAAETPARAAETPAVEVSSTALTLVKLNVPNMT